MKQLERLLATSLLKINAIKLQPLIPFTWRSGWRSPIYNDHRRALSYPKVRNRIKTEIARVIVEQFPEVDVVASVSTGAIAIGGIVADNLGLSFAYVRSTPKDHGLENRIEGNLKPHQKVILVEDVITTGANTIKALETVRSAGCEVVGIIAVFSFDFNECTDTIRKHGIPFVALTNYHTLVDVAAETQFVNDEEVKELRYWHKDPQNWIPQNFND